MRKSFAAIAVGILIACATPTAFDEDSGTTDSGTTDGGACPGSQKTCSNKCVDLTKDANNCGACANKCTAGQYCAASKCSNNCTPPLQICGQFCVDLDTDHENCGSCGKGCLPDQECKNKGCIKKCPLGLTVCDMDCVDMTSDPLHCGDCNTACGMNQICTGSLCCAVGQVACNGVCTSTSYDNNNCGACGFACGGNTPYCINGVCGAGISSTTDRIAGGYYHTCGITQQGTLKCWGYNPYGQLGDGTTANKSTPVAVSLANPASVGAPDCVVAHEV
jgi:hypothetical protein